MKLEEFREVIRRRIPTPEEFVSVVEAQGWKVVTYDDGRASLRCRDTGDKLAVALAKMLGREPYRTNVLKVVLGTVATNKWPRQAAPAPEPKSSANKCQWCGGAVDEKRRCWAKKCFSRPCEGCGRNTGSAFIANCATCGMKIEDES